MSLILATIYWKHQTLLSLGINLYYLIRGRRGCFFLFAFQFLRLQIGINYSEKFRI